MDRVARFETHWAYISRRWYRRDSTRDLSEGRRRRRRKARTISGTETFPAISCRASFYRRPMLFERNPVVSNNGWKKEEETRCPAQIYREAPPAPIYIHTPDDLHETRQHIPREWLVVLLLLLPSCEKRLGRVSKNWKWNWWLSKATIRSVVIIWRKKDWIWTDLLIENYMISMLRIDEGEEERWSFLQRKEKSAWGNVSLVVTRMDR